MIDRYILSLSPYVPMLTTSAGLDQILESATSNQDSVEGRDAKARAERIRRLCARASMTWVYQRLMSQHAQKMNNKRKSSAGHPRLDVEAVVDGLRQEGAWKWTSLWFPVAAGTTGGDGAQVRGRD